MFVILFFLTSSCRSWEIYSNGKMFGTNPVALTVYTGDEASEVDIEPPALDGGMACFRTLPVCCKRRGRAVDFSCQRCGAQLAARNAECKRCASGDRNDNSWEGVAGWEGDEALSKGGTLELMTVVEAKVCPIYLWDLGLTDLCSIIIGPLYCIYSVLIILWGCMESLDNNALRQRETALRPRCSAQESKGLSIITCAHGSLSLGVEKRSAGRLESTLPVKSSTRESLSTVLRRGA